MRAGIESILGQLVVNIFVAKRGLEKISDHKADVKSRLASEVPARDGQRRSRVIGSHGFTSSCGSVITPGVCVPPSNLSARRASASAAFAGRAGYRIPFGWST